MAELLSICIPTYNRAEYLRDLLRSLIAELEATEGARERTRVYLSDNASTDATQEVVESFRGRWPIEYHRNPTNIGGDYNFAQMIARAPGVYFWLLGDDELIIPGMLGPLLDLLQPELLGLVLLEAIGEDGQPYAPSPTPDKVCFPNYAAFVDHERRLDPWRLMLHSFISMMVIKHSSYDQPTNRRFLPTIDRNYAHMYAVVEGLTAHPGPIRLQRLPSILIRGARARVDTSIWKLAYCWSRYYRWLGEKFGHPDLVIYGRNLYGWRQRGRWLTEWIKRSVGLGPKLLR